MRLVIFLRPPFPVQVEVAVEMDAVTRHVVPVGAERYHETVFLGQWPVRRPENVVYGDGGAAGDNAVGEVVSEDAMQFHSPTYSLCANL